MRCRTTLTAPRPSGSGLPNRAGYIASLVCLLALSTWSHTNSANAQPQAEPAKDLADRLIRGESANEDIMVRIIKQMNHVEQRLSAAFDPGAETQRLQRRIVDRLDEAIAAPIRQASRSGASPGPMGDRRRPATPCTRCAPRPPPPRGRTTLPTTHIPPPDTSQLSRQTAAKGAALL